LNSLELSLSLLNSLELSLSLSPSLPLSPAPSDSSLSDVLCSVEVGPTAHFRRETTAKYRTSFCVWNSVYTIENLELTEEEYLREKITFSVFDRNVLSRNTMVGSFVFSLDTIHRQKHHEFYRKSILLSQPHDRSRHQGSLMVSVYVLKDGDPTPSHDEKDLTFADGEAKLVDAVVGIPKELYSRYAYLLNVLIYKAVDLVPTETYNGTCNPFVSISFNGASIQTKRMSNITNPIWNRKFEFPFYLPLTSDAIEITVYNTSSGPFPPVKIGSKTFSYFKNRLTHTAFGPSWVPLYSSKYSQPKSTSYLGFLTDAFSGGEESNEPSEYVGKMLMRMSVSGPKVDEHPKLRDVPCNPTADPEGDEYALHFALYQSSEIPVSGGKLRVELTFGRQRVASKWQLGKDGVFVWNESFDPIYLYAPRKLEQVQDIFLNVYMMHGNVQRKVVFERIPIDQLFDERRPRYFVNGKLENVTEWKEYYPEWRTLQHATRSADTTHIIPGFMLCTIGFGLRKYAPKARLKVLPTHFSSHQLICSLYQAANLPIAQTTGETNPFVVVRFAGSELAYDVQNNTTYPFWNLEKSTTVRRLDKHHAPSIFIMVYHNNSFGTPSLIGRGEVKAKDVYEHDVNEREEPNMCNKIMRVPIFFDEHPPQTLSDLEENEDYLPYVLVSLCVKKLPKGSIMSDIADTETKLEVKTKPYTLKLESIGIRALDSKGASIFGGINEPILTVDTAVSDSDSKHGNDSGSSIQCSEPVAGNIELFKTQVLRNVQLPLNNLHGVPMRVRLFERGMMGDTLVGAYTAPIANFINGPLEQPPWYVYHQLDDTKYHIDDDDDDDDDDMFHHDSKSDSESGSDDSEYNYDGEINTDDQKHSMRMQRRRKKNKVRRTVVRNEVGVAPFGSVLLDPDRANVTVVTIDETDDNAVWDGKFQASKAKDADDDTRRTFENKEEVLDEVEKRSNRRRDRIVFKKFMLRKGRSYGLDLKPDNNYVAFDDNDKKTVSVLASYQTCHANSGDIAGVLKAFVRVRPLVDELGMLQDDILKPYRRFYRPSYVVRLYIHKSFNLTPHDSTFGSNQVCNPYLRISNGQGEEHQFEDRSNYFENTMDPDHYKVLELPCRLPQNNTLVVSLMNRSGAGYSFDALIGQTTIDIEWRLLHNLAQAGREYRILRKPNSRIAQGKVLMELEILTEEEARRKKAANLRPPPAQEYELRMVLWSTKDMRFPKESDSDRVMNQKMDVIASFDGEDCPIKHTDVAYGGDLSRHADQDWNLRYIWRTKLPCKLPRIKLTLFDHSTFSSDYGIGEVQIDLLPFFSRALRDKAPEHHQPPEWLDFRHPNHPNLDKVGSVNVEMWLMTIPMAEDKPAGEMRDEPNDHPPLTAPHRELESWRVGSRTVGWFAGRKKLLMCLIAMALTLPILIPFILSRVGNSVF
jgi:C2 domain